MLGVHAGIGKKSEDLLTLYFKTTQGLLAMGLVILNRGEATRGIIEKALYSPNFQSTSTCVFGRRVAGRNLRTGGPHAAPGGVSDTPTLHGAHDISDSDYEDLKGRHEAICHRHDFIPL
ncbi:hypothetical protein TNCV_4062981 [Trichonephila clavipes]|nr:hypothetical protein TNCV_4062981 [Trichonephila clavipes]